MYLNIAIAHFAVFVILYLGFAGWLLCRAAKAFVYETPNRPPFLWLATPHDYACYQNRPEVWDYDPQAVFATFTLLLPFSGVVLSLGWPLTWPACLVIGGLLFARTCVRAQKAFRAHEHGDDGKVKQ